MACKISKIILENKRKKVDYRYLSDLMPYCYLILKSTAEYPEFICVKHKMLILMTQNKKK